MFCTSLHWVYINIYKSKAHSFEIMTTLEKRLDHIKGSGKRKYFLIKIYQEVLNYQSNSESTIRQSSMDALDYLLERAIDEHFRGEDSNNSNNNDHSKEEPLQHQQATEPIPTAALLEGTYYFRLKRQDFPSQKRFKYDLRLFNKTFFFYLPRTKESPQILEVKATLEDKSMLFEYDTNGSDGKKDKKTKNYIHQNFFYVSDLIGKYFENSQGVAVRKTDATHGRIYLGNRIYNFGANETDKHIIVFFDTPENIFFFDAFGNMLFPTLSKEEVFEKKRICKTLDICKAIEEFKIREYSKLIVDRVRELWREAPESFQNRVNRPYFLLSGKVDGRLDYLGRFSFAHSTNGKTRKQIGISKSYPHKDIVLEFLGPYVKASHKGEPINAHELDDVIKCCNGPNSRLHNLEYVYAMTTTRRDYVICWSHSVNHYFSMREIKRLYGKPIKSVKHLGILANTMDNYFEVLIIDNEDNFTSFPIKPYSKSTKKQISQTREGRQKEYSVRRDYNVVPFRNIASLQ